MNWLSERLHAVVITMVVVTMAAGTVAFVGWQKIENLETRVADLSREVESLSTQTATLRTQLAATTSRLDLIGSAANSALAAARQLDGDLDDLKGFNWSFLSRGVGQLDDDLATVEECLRSIVDLIDGFGYLLDFSCDNLPF